VSLDNRKGSQRFIYFYLNNIVSCKTFTGTILDIYLSFDRMFENINPENFTFKGKTVTRQNISIKNISVNLSLVINISDKIIFVKISMVKISMKR